MTFRSSGCFGSLVRGALPLIIAALLCGCSSETLLHHSSSGFIEPENALEEALIKAAREPRSRVSFEELVLSSRLYVRVHADSVQEVTSALGADGKLTRSADVKAWAFQNEDGELVVPVFTSAARLKAVYPGEPYISLVGRDAIKLAGGHPIQLNHGLAPRVRWSASEAAAMLSRSRGGVHPL
jgi:hypothetical protein